MAIKREKVIVTCSGGAGSSTGSEQTDEPVEGVILAVRLEYLKILAFTSGSVVPQIGDQISGATGGATGVIEQYEVTSGTWAGGDAAGNIWIRDQSGTFQSENLDNDTASETNFATIGADSTAVAATTDVVVDENIEAPPLPVLTVSNNNTSGWYYPRITLHDGSDGSAIVGPVDYQSVADYLGVAVAGANDNDALAVSVVWDDLRNKAR